MSKGRSVNLDAMILREDLVARSNTTTSYENVNTISIRDFGKDGFIGKALRKPDFQRETNHWNPEQVVSLLECFVNGDLIPSVILWQSESYLFVIDGGHRLSVIKAWLEDDYGDGPLSNKFFGGEIPKQQKDTAAKSRKLINERIGSFQHIKAKIDSGEIDSRITTVISRGIPIQWVKGNVDKAESSFFKINTQGTPLDKIEELLLQYRKYPIPISARAVIRSGFGHKYWSYFESEIQQQIENTAHTLSQTIFEPEINTPIKTLDLPLGGPRGVRDALQVLIDYFSIAVEINTQKPLGVKFNGIDGDGNKTLETLKRGLKLAHRITGNTNGSLGLHPAIYFYGPTGGHSLPMFLGTARLLSRKIADNHQTFFQDFTSSRSIIENHLIKHKELISTILQKLSSRRRVTAYEIMLSKIIEACISKQIIDEEILIEWGGVSGKVLIGNATIESTDFSDDDKSAVFIKTAISSAPKCPICNGYIDNKSISYDHIVRKQDGGKGSSDNCQLTHPFCNQSIKN